MYSVKNKKFFQLIAPVLSAFQYSFIAVFSLSLHCPHNSLSPKPLHLRPLSYFAPIQILLSKTCAPECKPFSHLWFSAVLLHPLWICIKHPTEHTYCGCTHSLVTPSPVSILLVVCSALHHTAVSRLINSTHLILIRPETIIDLSLHIRKLNEPQCTTIAINSQRHTFQLYDFVVLTLSSLNNAWTSHPIRALLAPDLCVNILLGLPFLKHNKIIIDHDSDIAIDKISGFDLLNENKSSSLSSPHPSSNHLSPLQKCNNILHVCCQVMEELSWHCKECRLVLKQDNLFESVTSFNPIGAITSTVLCLASQKDLLTLNENIKNDFKSFFKPISHINQLPPHEPACIHLKDAYKKSQLDLTPAPVNIKRLLLH